jgi:hypothetical protein
VQHYNDGVMPDTLGFFGEHDNFEWKQYQLQEPGSLNPARCPFHAHAAHPTPTTDRELTVNTALTATYALTVLLLIATPARWWR